MMDFKSVLAMVAFFVLLSVATLAAAASLFYWGAKR